MTGESRQVIGGPELAAEIDALVSENERLREALPNVEMLRRAATASRNMAKGSARSDWSAWVPQHLDRLADDVEAVLSGGSEDQT